VTGAIPATVDAVARQVAATLGIGAW